MHALKNVGILGKSSAEFLAYLASKYGKDVHEKNKLKIHLESGDIYQENINTKKSLHSFLRAQEDVSKKFVNLGISLSGDFEYYVREVLGRVTNDKMMFIRTAHQTFYFIVLIILGDRLVCRLLQ